MSMLGFFFADKHSQEFADVVMERAGRGILPSLRRNDYEISGRHGTIDFGGEMNNTRQIPVNITIVSKDEETLQELAHQVAFWLRGKGLLIFDDNQQRAFDAVVYEAVDADELITAKRTTVIFECQPFAKTIHHLQSINTNVSNGRIIPIVSAGTQSTPCLIFFSNTGNTNITNLRITRRALQR